MINQPPKDRMLRPRDVNTRDEHAAFAAPRPLAASPRRANTAEVIGRDPRLTNVVATRDGIVDVGNSRDQSQPTGK
jgi:hypothetical protein